MGLFLYLDTFDSLFNMVRMKGYPFVENIVSTPSQGMESTPPITFPALLPYPPPISSLPPLPFLPPLPPLPTLPPE
jgi:hypothetical protein